MEFLSNKPLLITDTILRDAHQSQAATRMTLEQMLPACEILDSIGYYSLECWGGATFDACLRFLDEDPWERLRQLRAHLPHTKLQMLFRGQNILGYKHYADDVVDEFCGKSIDNGIDIIRIFDALNDVRNLEQAIKSTKKYGGQVEATLSYTISPIHNEDYFVKLAKELEQMGADALCIKDMANLLLPMYWMPSLSAAVSRAANCGQAPAASGCWASASAFSRMHSIPSASAAFLALCAASVCSGARRTTAPTTANPCCCRMRTATAASVLPSICIRTLSWLS